MGKAEANAPYNWPAIHKFHCNFDLQKKKINHEEKSESLQHSMLS
jgi:hypothetical protein